MAPGLNLSLLVRESEDHHSSTLSTTLGKTEPTTISAGTTVLVPSLVTEDFDLLRFEAAAQGQLDTSESKTGKDGDIKRGTAPELSSLLISSPYNNAGHYLDLKDLDTPNLIFAKALTALKPVRADYATAPYLDALDFSVVLELIRKLAKEENYEWKEQTFYVVIFRSQLKEDSDRELLYTLDYESHREACESGGLLKYWFGAVDSERRNLATCFWRSREDARLGGLGPWHKKARAAGRELYESIIFSTHRFTVLDGAQDLKFEKWE
ncbi:hypothetical protein EJ04DRAFT_490567 [Polyplosphaeria fusca]|uniref:Uncharacterized protein n=1 Tax=Polyplosphaeria fusca TaxID=682080 RepID=A0A9P4V2X6_9PLEO|nr:hypothetical protein EJ04DRAFT_490567 [Polyplosphaeria fusca]